MDATSGAGQARGHGASAGCRIAASKPIAKDLRQLDQVRRALYGALDLGTNNCRLLIATPAEQGFVVVDAFSRIVRLGEGLGQTGRLSDAGHGRAPSRPCGSAPTS